MMTSALFFSSATMRGLPASPLPWPASPLLRDSGEESPPSGSPPPGEAPAWLSPLAGGAAPDPAIGAAGLVMPAVAMPPVGRVSRAIRVIDDPGAVVGPTV